MATREHTETPTDSFNGMDLELHKDKIRGIRSALVIGLTAYGEIERLCSAAEIARIGKMQIPDGLEPIHPSGDAGTVGDFADAFSYLQMLEDMPLTR
ncbi:MAG: hypothetical protein H6948_05350 [Zoogloeaceae bacterium]|nr:hypothetical protein [Zoogloeaceae bacterium]